MTPLSDLWDVAKIVGKGLAGELSDDDIRRRDTDPAPPPATSAARPSSGPCPRCDGEREVVIRSVVVPCPVCRGT